MKLQKDEIDMTAVFQIANGEGGSEANRPLKLQLTELASGSNNVHTFYTARIPCLELFGTAGAACPDLILLASAESGPGSGEKTD